MLCAIYVNAVKSHSPETTLSHETRGGLEKCKRSAVLFGSPGKKT